MAYVNILGLGLAGAVGAWITAAVNPETLRWVLGLSFIGMAIWTMIPDKIEEEETRVAHKFGVFGATLVTFFLAEMGDKLSSKIPMKLVHSVAAALFAILGIAILLGAGASLGI